MYELRPYQEEARRAIHEEWDNGRRKTLVVAATGTGKTVIFGAIAKDCVDNGERVLILAHRGELLEQAADKLKNAYNLDSALEKAESTSLGSMNMVTVGSVQSFCREKRLTQFPKDYFSTIIVDEAHHVLSDTYQRVLEHFGGAKVLGMTATPDRGDMKDLGVFFDSLAYEYPIAKAVKDGYLCPIKAQMIPLQIDLSHVKISAGDYSAGDAGNAIEPYLEQIASEMEQYCKARKTVVFLPLIAISQKFCGILQERGFRAAEVNGESDDRKEILEEFDSGEYDVLCNSMLLTEGWDCPSVNCIVVLRPTKMRGLYCQMVGRGMRLAPGKKDLLLLDFLWLTEKHDLCRPSALISKSAETAERMDEILASDQGTADIVDVEARAEGELLDEREKALAETLEKTRHKKRKLVDPLQYAMSIAAEDLVDYVPAFAWESEPATEKQLEVLKRKGIHPEAVTCKGQASKMIDHLVEREKQHLATPKQIRCLERYGFEHVGQWKFEDASSMISIIAKNGWKLPHGIFPEGFTPF